MTTQKFNLGRVLASPLVTHLEKELPSFSAVKYIKAHHAGDWGDLCDEDKEENELALTQGFRIFSAYSIEDLEGYAALGFRSIKVFVITEHDRSSTTILLSEEY